MTDDAVSPPGDDGVKDPEISEGGPSTDPPPYSGWLEREIERIAEAAARIERDGL